MTMLSPTLRLRSAASAVVLAGLAFSAAPAAATDVQYEYFEQYETAFMAACTGWNSPRTCHCAMASIEDQIGFEQFALATLRTEGDVFNDQRWDRAAFRAVETCTSMASPATD